MSRTWDFVPSVKATRVCFCVLSAVLFASGLLAQEASSPDTAFLVEFERGAITSLQAVGDTVETDYAKGQRLGDAALRFRAADSDWQTVSTAQLASQPTSELSTSENNSRHTANYRVTADGSDDAVLDISTEFAVHQGQVSWQLTLKNKTSKQIDISDLSLPLPVNRSYSGKQREERVLKHSFISGHGSFLFWIRQNTVGPYLTLVPDKSTSFEYWDYRGLRTAREDGEPSDRRRRGSYNVYAHSTSTGDAVREQGGTWRLPRSETSLAPQGQAGDKKTYGYSLHLAKDYDAVRDILANHGQLDVHVVPGMTVPSDLSVRFAIRSSDEIHSLEAEHADHTQLKHIGREGDYDIYSATFNKLGENLLTIHHGENRQTFLEFFATEPVETLIKKRAAFIAKSQHRDPSKWYDGLITDWNMRDGVLPSPDNYDLIEGWRIYAVTCDDPGLGKPAYLAAKLAEFPTQDEVEALDYYIENFVWGGLQRTTDETYPYGIYGIPDWKQNRESDEEGPDGKLHIWRCYDYPHVIAMYYHMYRVAKNYPQIETKLTAQEYLERARGTTAAFFTVPMEVRRWSPYGTGYYNELVIPEVVDALEQEGMTEQADELRQHWERKVNSFVSGRLDLFRSEYAFDSTGFESTHALAKYALEHGDELSARFDNFSEAGANDFMQAQMAANLFCRGWLEPAYYLLGSDYRGGGGDRYTLTYMSQMGGWAVLDYGLNYAKHADPYLRLGYASYLSSWALMNSGTSDSDYGYWFPGQENDGGAGGGFEAAPYGRTWLGQPHRRGSWLYSCEIDLGYCGALRTAATVLADDDIFGRVCYGGDWSKDTEWIEVTPKDGLRRRFYAMLDGAELQVMLQNNRFVAGPSIRLNEDLSGLELQLERTNPEQRTASLHFKGLPNGKYVAQIGNSSVAEWQAEEADILSVDIPIPAIEAPIQITIKRVGP